MTKTISLYSWNVNGIRSVLNKGTLKAFVEKEQPDILCLQEIKAEEHQAETEFPQFIEYWNPSVARKGYSGTAIFTRTEAMQVVKNLPDDIVEKYALAQDKYGNPNNEGRVLAAEYSDFWVVTSYSPNSKPDLSRLKMRCEQWDTAFLEYLKRLEQSKPVIVCGDLNVAHTEDDLASPKTNRGKHGFTDEERASFDKMTNSGFVDTFRIFSQGNGAYTWWSNFANARARNVGWRIDYFLVSSSLKDSVQTATIHADVMGSDHCPVGVKIVV